MYTLIYADNNNAKIKLITRFFVYECVCVFMWDEEMWSRGRRTLQIRRGFQEIEKSRKICCLQKRWGKKREKELRAVESLPK